MSSLKFPLGQVVITRAAMAALIDQDVQRAIARHVAGDWGDLVEADKAENEFSVREGFRLLSSYHTTDGTKFWIITEADRSVTTILLPDDY